MSNKSDIDAAREYYETHSVVDEINNSVPGNPADTSPMSGYSVRLPTEVLNRARKLAAERGMTTGAWLREAIEKQIVAGGPRDQGTAHGNDASAATVLRELVGLYMDDVTSSRDSALAAAIDPWLGSLKARRLRDWNAAHLRELNVLSLIAGGGTDRWAVLKHSKPESTETATGDKEPAAKVGARHYFVAGSVVRDGHTVRVRTSTPTGRRRRRTTI
ncbi:hypothetical protein [Nocardia testacea]|uniref:hypothetical protein n=1 Tax=Nocardia testacea TaxID=248551 RepID=UPI000308FB1E|nr:hypothetical protein [Nocardia testacea]